jgi:hypothetical protein
MRRGWCLFGAIYFAGIAAAVALTRTGASSFRFERDTFAFMNSTVFEYRAGQISARKRETGPDATKPYTRRCFVMSRTALQFYKFARFDARAAPLDDKTLASRIRQVTRRHPWNNALAENARIVFPGYASLREMSKTRGRILQENIGLGWPTYARPGNYRMFFVHGEKYQEKTHADLNATLARGDFFVAYLSDYPNFHINHAVLVYDHKPARNADGIEHYMVYDPNHPDAPRDLKWSPASRVFNYEKDEEFVGGFTRVYHVYGKWLQ